MPKQVERLRLDTRPKSIAEAVLRFTPQLLDNAVAFAEAADDSYRHYNVGNGSLAVDRRGQYFGLYSANFKARENGGKLCAEPRAVALAKRLVAHGQASGLRIISFHVDAPPQADTHSGEHYPTLHPCGLCRGGRAALASEIVDRDAVVVTRKRDSGVHQVFNLSELDLIHIDPEHYQEVGHRVIDDPGYARLKASGLESLALLQSDIPEAGSHLSAAAEVRLAWAA